MLHRLRNAYVEELCFGQFLLLYDPLCAIEKVLGPKSQLLVRTLKLDRLAGSLESVSRFIAEAQELIRFEELHCYSFW